MLQKEQREASLTHIDHPSSQSALTVATSNQNSSHRGGFRGGHGGRNTRGGRGSGHHNGRNNFQGGGNFNGGGYFSHGPQHVQSQRQQQQQRGEGGAWAYGWFQVHQPRNEAHQAGILPAPSAANFQPNNTRSKHQFGAHQHQFFSPSQPSSSYTIKQAFHTLHPTQSQIVEPTTLPQMFNTMNLNDPGQVEWHMDTGATSHFHSNAGIHQSGFEKK